MTCDKINELINLFVDGELDSAGQDEMFAHLSDCADCRSFLQGLVQIRDIMHREQVAFPEETDRAVLESAGSRRTAPVAGLWRGSINLPFPVAAAAALLVVVIGMWLSGVFGDRGQGRQVQASADLAAAGAITETVIYALPPIEVTPVNSVGK